MIFFSVIIKEIYVKSIWLDYIILNFSLNIIVLNFCKIIYDWGSMILEVFGWKNSF